MKASKKNTVEKRQTASGSELMNAKDWPNFLIQPDDWFLGPDGTLYRSVYGPVDMAVAKMLIGVEPTGNGSTNWFAFVGKPGRQLVIAGCRIHYAVMCQKRPANMANTLDLSE